MKYLVTGGAGFIGSHLSNKLHSRGDEVVVFDDLSRGDKSRLHPDIKIIPFNISHYESLLIEMRDVDFVFHLAASVGVKRCMDNLPSTISNNISATSTVVRTAATLKKPIFFASTSEVYGVGNGSLFTEGDSLVFGDTDETRWIYSQTKAIAESLLYYHKQKSGLKFIVGRLFNTVGAGQNAGYGAVMPAFTKQARGGDNLTVFGTGSQIRSFCHVSDTVDAIIALADAERYGEVYNIGNPEPVSIKELAEKIIKQTGSNSTITYVPYEDAYGEGFAEVPVRVPNISKIKKDIGWEPKLSLTEIIDRMI